MDDVQIVELFWKRDEQAVVLAEKQYGAYCTSIAVQILENKQDAEECVNDAILRTWKSIPPNKPEKLAVYIGRITRNLALNRYRAEHRQKRGQGNMPLILDELSEVVSAPETVEQELDRRALIAAINDFLAGLSEQKRFVFVRRYWYADSVNAIAKGCGISENRLSVQLYRLRRQLQTHLRERGFIV